jgi:hypothetical protein
MRVYAHGWAWAWFHAASQKHVASCIVFRGTMPSSKFLFLFPLKQAAACPHNNNNNNNNNKNTRTGVAGTGTPSAGSIWKTRDVDILNGEVAATGGSVTFHNANGTFADTTFKFGAPKLASPSRFGSLACSPACLSFCSVRGLRLVVW